MGMPSVLVQRPQPVVQVIAAILSTAGALMLLESALLHAARWTPAALTTVTDRQKGLGMLVPYGVCHGTFKVCGIGIRVMIALFPDLYHFVCMNPGRAWGQGKIFAKRKSYDCACMSKPILTQCMVMYKDQCTL